MSARTKKNGKAKKHIPCDCRDCRRLAELRQNAIDEHEAQKKQDEAERLAGPAELVSYTDAAEAINKLRLYHHQVVEDVAVKLRPRFEAGELYGALESRDDPEAKGLNALLDEIRQRAGGREDACLTLAFSPSTEAVSEYAAGESLVDQAVQALASDVLRVARLRRFYEMKPTEALDLWA